MADPLAAFATISALVIRAFTLSKDVYIRANEITNAPQHIRAITSDLEDFYSLLGTLTMYLDEESDLSVGLVHSAGRTNLEKVLDNCITVFDRTNILVGSYKAIGGTSISTWRKMKYSFKLTETEALRSELAAHKLSLNIAISLVNFLSTNIRNASSQRSEMEITRHFRYIEEKLPEILRNLEEIKATTLSSGERRTPSFKSASVNAADTEVRSYLEQETASISSGVHTLLAPSSRADVVEFLPGGMSSAATSTYHSALSYTSWQKKLQDLPENCTQIFVRGPTEKTHSLHVDPNSTLEDIKATLSDRTGVRTDLLFFIWGGKILPDKETLESLNIPHDATLSCNARVIGQNGQIEVQFSDGKISRIPYEWQMSILDLKAKLINQERILSLEEVRLTSCGKQLDNNNTVAGCGIVGGSKIDCVLRSRYSSDPSNGGQELSHEDLWDRASFEGLSRIRRTQQDRRAVGRIRGWPRSPGGRRSPLSGAEFWRLGDIFSVKTRTSKNA